MDSIGQETIGGSKAISPPLYHMALPDSKSEEPGGLTWNAEGVSDPQSKYYSRRLHHPSARSGVTLGRGYDMKLRDPVAITMDLFTAGVELPLARQYAQGAQLSGSAAATFVKNADLPDLDEQVEKNLFYLDYRRYELDTTILTESKIRNEIDTHFSFLVVDSRIREVLIDLKYRGDLTRSKLAMVAPSIARNDLDAFTRIISDRALWSGVPKGRFEERKKFLLKP